MKNRVKTKYFSFLLVLFFGLCLLHLIFCFSLLFFFLLLVFSFLTPLPALLPVLNLHLVFLSHQSLSHQCPCTNVYRETSWNTHFKQDRHNVVPKAKPVYPAASGSSSSSLICDSLQRSIYQSLQQFMCLFFFFGCGRNRQEIIKWRQETREPKNIIFYICCHRIEHFTHHAPLNTAPQSGIMGDRPH